MTGTIQILLVEDEGILASLTKEFLETRGFTVKIETNGVEGWSAFNYNKPDICIFDIMMPRKDGYSLLQDIRKVDELIPIIMLTAKTQTENVLKGLELGADDYLKKPFSMEELILRIKGLLRRSKGAADPLPSTDDLFIGASLFSYQNLQLTVLKETINMSRREAELLMLLVEYKNRLLDRNTALLKLWGDDTVFNARSMDVYITKLRKYLLPDETVSILNIRGRGFKLQV